MTIFVFYDTKRNIFYRQTIMCRRAKLQFINHISGTIVNNNNEINDRERYVIRQ